jgi:hypothetical protein
VRVATPTALRAAVLNDMRRELNAARWDRRLGRVAVVLLTAGIVLNVLTSLPSNRAFDDSAQLVDRDATVVRTALAVASATDAETGRRYARQLAMLGGRSLTARQVAVIDAAIAQQASRPRL